MAVPDVSDRTLADLFSLTGRIALVTGGARGIGEAVARRLAEAGAAVAIGDRNGDAARATATRLSSETNNRLVGFDLDVTDEASVEACLAAAQAALGPVDILVNNAGLLGAPAPFLDMDRDAWDRTMDVNVTGVLNCSRVFARALIAREQPGVILNVASTASFRVPNPGTIIYTTSKHALNSVTKTMALELGQHNIRVLEVAPVVVETPGIKELRDASIARSAVDKSVVKLGTSEAFAGLPLGRTAVPDDVARVVVFGVSDLATLMTGCTLVVDAGSMIR
jgi:NAD(P)-dependent dehydrogenase (short-subunit alcohol dehydrogenase family)